PLFGGTPSDIRVRSNPLVHAVAEGQNCFTSCCHPAVRFPEAPPMKMSETRELQNQRALARLTKALPEIFPAPVLTYALNRRWTPPMPRLAIDGYWRAHPLRADRLTRALARRSGTPDGWTWRWKEGRKSDLPPSIRMPPAPCRGK